MGPKHKRKAKEQPARPEHQPKRKKPSKRQASDSETSGDDESYSQRELHQDAARERELGQQDELDRLLQHANSKGSRQPGGSGPGLQQPTPAAAAAGSSRLGSSGQHGGRSVGSSGARRLLPSPTPEDDAGADLDGRPPAADVDKYRDLERVSAHAPMHAAPHPCHQHE